jgi:hypothetical protein
MSRKAKAPRVFVPLTKVDEEQRLVYGTITQEVLDKSGEVMDYDASKGNFQKWSDDIHQASGGLSKGNLRVMHGLTVAGKVTDLDFNDEDKTIEVCTKVVDDSEWEKVKEGCYTGFSVGGKYGKKWKETIDGQTITKYEAIPNEVSLVDNPCVPSATFSLVKADGAEEQVMFKAAVADDQDPGDEAPEDQDTGGESPTGDETVTKSEGAEPSNEEVASRATELAKAANDGTTWVDHIETARLELTKAAKGEKDDDEEGKKGKEKSEAEPAAETAADAEAAADEDGDEEDDDKAAKADTAVLDRLTQKWETSDGKTFEKKADAAAHEETLAKAAVEPTEADKLRARLEKAISGPEDDEGEPELPLFEDLDRMSKVVSALSTPFEDGQPKLEKGMYTVNRFSSVLSDMASLSRSIKAEGKREGDDSTDSTVSADIIGAVKTLGASFIAYATDQVQELLAGMDDDVVVSYHDYYYNCVQNDPENGLAKDVCETINSLREAASERREDLIKGFGFVAGEDVQTDELSPPMQKRFDALTAENEELKKVATDAVTKVEELAKRVEEIADQPQPRAPRDGSVVFKEGDVNFLGKSFSNPQDLMNEVHDLIKTKGPDALAVELIKASQAGGGQRLHLNR